MPIVHPARRRGDEEGASSIPKGEYAEGEAPQACALREFEEETGTALPGRIDLGRHAAERKVVTAWAAEGDLDADAIKSNEFEMEWRRARGGCGPFPRSTVPGGSASTRRP